MLVLGYLLIGLAACGAAQSCRNRFWWPFDAASIWNTPIGSDAQYIPAGIYPTSADYPVEIHNDQEWLIQSTASDPQAPWMDDTGTFPGGCTTTAPIKGYLPMPANLTTDCEPNNNSGGLLMPDNTSLIQFAPFYRATAGGPFLAWYHNGDPDPFPWNTSILGSGALGSHGGSGLSGFGGSIRVGELTNVSNPIKHALKLELWAHMYYFYDWQSGFYNSCYTWPATGCDTFYHNVSGIGYNGTNPFLKPGALLAVPPNVSEAMTSSITTVPGLLLLQALTDYGGYIVDDTGSEQGGGAFCAEHDVTAEVQGAFGYSISISNPLTSQQGAPLYWDLVHIFQALHVVVNNGPDSIGGGGVPRAPPPPPICDE